MESLGSGYFGECHSQRQKPKTAMSSILVKGPTSRFTCPVTTTKLVSDGCQLSTGLTKPANLGMKRAAIAPVPLTIVPEGTPQGMAITIATSGLFEIATVVRTIFPVITSTTALAPHGGALVVTARPVAFNHRRMNVTLTAPQGIVTGVHDW